jgi:hypothetical protein
MSEIVINCVPGLFIVPSTVTSPALTRSAVTIPEMGERTVDFVTVSWFTLTMARFCSIRCFRRLVGALGAVVARLGALKIGVGDDARFVVLPRPIEVALRLVPRRPRGFEVGQAGLNRGGGARLFGGGPLLVDLKEEIAFVDSIPLLHHQVHDLAHHEGGEVDFVFRLDLPVGDDLADDVLNLDLRDADLRRLDSSSYRCWNP